MKFIYAVLITLILATPMASAKNAAKESEVHKRKPSSIGPCAMKVKEFAEKFGSHFLDISADGGSTSIEQTNNRKIVKVTLTNANGSRIRELLVKHGSGECSIVGVESLDSELE